MSVINLNETRGSWRPQAAGRTIRLFLDTHGEQLAELAGARVDGFPLELAPVPVTDWIDPQALAGAAAAVIQVDADTPASIKRFERLAAAAETPLIAAAYEPPLALVRSLIRAGAHDVVPLPIDLAELETSLAAIHAHMAHTPQRGGTVNGKLVTVIKSFGGVGATALITQLASRFAASEAAQGREVCLIDLDVQFGNAAFYLNLRPKLSIMDLIEAGTRIDGAMLRAATTVHASGLSLIDSPPEMIPLESLTSDQVIGIVDVARREYRTVFADLPTNWTNWSLSLLARSDLVLLVTEMTVAGLHRARRQLDLIAAQELGDINIRVVANRFEKGMFRSVKPADATTALGCEVAYTIANDYAVMSTAIDHGVPIEEVRRKSPLVRDIQALDAGLAAALGLER